MKKSVYYDREIKVRESKYTLTKVRESRSRKKIEGARSFKFRHQPHYWLYVVKLIGEEVGFFGR